MQPERAISIGGLFHRAAGSQVLAELRYGFGGGIEEKQGQDRNEVPDVVGLPTGIEQSNACFVTEALPDHLRRMTHDDTEGWHVRCHHLARSHNRPDPDATATGRDYGEAFA
jgi:hypothetical protein